MPQYQGQFYTGKQAAGDVLREVLQGIARGRQQSAQSREEQRMEAERAQLQADRANERTYQRGRDAQGDARVAAQDRVAAEQRTMQDAQLLAELRKRGVFRGTAPKNITEQVDLTGIGGVGRSFVQSPTRYSQLNDGYMLDEAKTPEARLNDAVRAALTNKPDAIAQAVQAGMTPEQAMQLVNRPGSAGALAAKRADLTLQDEFAAKADQRQFGYSSQLAKQRADNAPGPKLSAVPMKVVEQTLDSEALGSALGSLDALLQSEDGGDAVGLLDGIKPTRFISERGQQVRSMISNVNSTLMKLRSGSAVTPSEAKRLEDFTITKWDDEATMRTKVAQLREFLVNRARDNREYYSQDNGYRELPAPRSSAAPASPSAPTPQARARRNPY